MRKTLKSVICAVMVLAMMLTMTPSYAFAEGNDEGVESFQTDTSQETSESEETQILAENDGEITVETTEEENTKEEIVPGEEGEAEPESEDTETTVKTDEYVKKEIGNVSDGGKKGSSNLQRVKRAQVQSVQTFSATPEVHADENTGIVNSLNDVVSNVTITGATQNEDGSYTVYKGSNYGLQLTFTESEGKQIPFNDGINYILPEGFAIINLGETITIQATITHEGSTTTQDVRFLVSYNGNVITMTPAENQGEVLEALGRANDAQFSLNINASWNGDNGNHEIDFGNDVKVTIDVPSDADLQYRKSAVYNKEAGTVDYTITVSSEGNSTGVVITDTLAGDAVTIKTDTIKVTSSTGNASKVGFSQTDETGFTTDAFNMSNGETITITYSAAVDYSKLDGNEITFDDVKNTVVAESDQKPDPDPVDTTFTDAKAFDYAVKGMGEGGSSTLTDANKDVTGEYYILPWKIDVNPDFYATGNITFTDTLQNSELQKYDPDSFEIKAYNENGEEVNIPSGTYTLPLQDAPQWNQTLPAQIGGVTVRYEITYNTRVKVSDIPPYAGTSVENEITVGDDTSNPGSVTVPPQLEYEVNKDVRSYDIEGKTANWQVTVDVPAEGFSQSFEVTDTLPSLWYGNPNTLYKHTLDQASLEVKLGDRTLTSGEDYTFEYKDNPYGEDSFVLTFHMNARNPGEENSGGGIPPANQEQKITISYTTSYESWISGQAVVNSVNVEADGWSEGDNAQYTPVDKEIVKEANSNYSGSDITHPVTYTVAVIGVTQGDLDGDGYITVTDEFDPEYLRYVDRTWGGGKTVYGTQSPGSYNGTSAGEYEMTESPAGNLTFRFKPELRTSDEGTQEYYARYYFSYELAIKDEAALQTLIELAAGEGEGSSYATSLTTDFLKNTATWGSSSDELTVQFDSNPLQKENIDPVSGSNGYTATWKITINETGAELNNGSDMEITDDFTTSEDEYEMTYVQDSMVVKYDGEEQSSPQFTYDDSGILRWIIPDSTKVEIEYKTQITGNVTGKSKIRNDAEITGKGVGDSVEQNFDISSGGSGTASATGFSIYKVDVNDETLPLKGAVFQLWCTNGDGEKIPFEYIDPDTNERVSQPITFATDEDGIVHVNSDQDRNGWSLYRHRVYILEEVEAPAGYEDVSEDPIEITIWIDNYGGNVNENLDEVPCPENAVVIQPNTTIRVVNGQITVPVSKTLTGRNWTDDEFQVQITPQGNAPAVTSDIITLTKERQEGEFTLSGFRQPGTYKYTITEVEGTDEEVNYSKAEYEVTVNVTQVQDEDGTNYYDVTSDIRLVKDYAGNATDVSVNEAQFVNSVGQTTSVSVSKKWEGSEGQPQSNPESIQIQLMAGDVAQGAPITLNAENDWKYTWTNLAVQDENGNTINYTVHELGESSGTVELDGSEYKVTYEGDAETGYTITNSYVPEKIEIPVTKNWLDGDDQDGIRPNEITVKLLANGEDTGKTLILNAANNWSDTFTGLAKYENGKAIEYTVEEARVEGYEKAITGNMTDGFIITNSHIPDITEVSGNKTWNDNNNQDGKRPESITINLLANGNEIADKEVSANENWSWRFTDLPKYENGRKIIYTITEDAVPDYTTEINGYNVTNTYTSGKTDVSVIKSWDDADDQDGKRPESIQVQLYADGEAYGAPVTLRASDNPDDNWKYTWTGLDERSEGKEIEYTVKEVGETAGKINFDGTEYQVTYAGDAVTGYTITNGYTPETTEVSGSKTWNDNNDQDGKRPESITIRLLANGTEADKKEISADDNWSWNFTNLPKDENGKAIEYTITEDKVPNYTTVVNGYDVTNTYTPGKTSVSVTKSWNDANDQDGKRSDSIQVQLYADGEAYGIPVTLRASDNPDDNWKYTWIGLDERSEGKEIEYTVKEVGATDGKIDFDGTEYQVTYAGDAVTGYTITNSYTPETTEVSGSKTWNDNNNQDGKRPESITIRLLANGTEADKKEISADDNWSWRFTDLPKYEKGTEITYTITEDAVTDYTTVVDGYDVTNSYTPDETSVGVTKSWNDNNDQDGIRPNEITVKLLANGEDTGKTLTLNASNNWSGTFTGLTKYEDGKEIKYTVEEEGIEGYETVITGNITEGYIITNGHIPETTEVSGNKIWNDNNNQDGKRPESIIIRLLANGTEADKKEISADDNWSWRFTDLPKYENGRKIIYTISEYAVTDYTPEIDGYDVTNIHTPGKTSISVTKSWDDAGDQDGKRPENIQVQLYADGEAQGEPVALNAENKWNYIWSGLDEKTEGKAIKYTVKEVGETDGKINFDGTEYQVTYEGDATTGYTITNSYTPETTEVSGNKTWNDNNDQDGKRPESITIRLLANGTEVDKKEVGADDNWSWNFTDLPKYENGTEIIYTITEDAVTDYTTVVDGYDVTNSYTPDKTSVSVTKSWQDNNDQDGIRPNEITVKLLANGEDTGKTLTLNAANSWSGSFTGLAKYEDREEIKYTVEEEGVEGYETVVTGNMTEGYIITNSHNPETTEVSGSKTWNDNNDQDGKRPESITIRLLANGTEVAKKEISADDDWSWNFTDLPKYENGAEITYTITEDAVPDYTTEINGYDVTNNYKPGKTSVTVTKSWNDSGDQDGKRPDSIQVQLYADGEEQGEPVVLAAENNWSYIWSELDEKSAGKAIEYTVKEVGETEGKIDFDGAEYQVTYTGDAAAGYEITNSYNTETVEVSGSKTWNDKGNEGARPESIMIRLYADNEEVARAEVTAENDWSWSFDNLPKYRDGGQEIIYTISEDAVDNYITEVNGYDVTNTYQPGETSVSVAKRWNDSGNRDGKRPESVKVQLYADDEALGDPVILNRSNDWRYTWSELDKQADGKEIVYTVKEVGENKGTIDFDGTEYKVTYTGNAAKGYTITNSYNAVSTSVQTGDDTNMRSNLAVMAAAMTVAGAVLIFRRRRYNKKYALFI